MGLTYRSLHNSSDAIRHSCGWVHDQLIGNMASGMCFGDFQSEIMEGIALLIFTGTEIAGSDRREARGIFSDTENTERT
jgi:hypothetical protein